MNFIISLFELFFFFRFVDLCVADFKLIPFPLLITAKEKCISDNLTDLIIRTIISCLPAWIRMVQCLRRYHDDNKGKSNDRFLFSLLFF